MSGTIEELSMDTNPERYVAWHEHLDESVSDNLLTERELSVRSQVREIVAAEVAPCAAEIDRTHAFAGESYQTLAKAGLAGLIFPQRLGGTGDSNVAYAIAMEEISAGCPATSLIYMTQTHAAYPILLAGSDELAQDYIPKLLSGEHYGSMAITEPDAGSDVASMTTRSVATTSPEGTAGYSINGSKTFITTGDKADTIVLFATVDPALGRKGVTALVVEGDTPGLSKGQPFSKMGMNGSSTAELFFSDAFVPARNRLGEEGSGWKVVMASVTKSRISAAAQGVGIARSAYVRTLAALQQLHGSRIPDDAKFALAEMRGDILRGRLLLIATAREVDLAENPSTAQIGIMKQACTDLGWKTSLAAARILGSFGDSRALGVERLLRDSKVTQIYDGTNEVQRLLIGRETERGIRELA